MSVQGCMCMKVRGQFHLPSCWKSGLSYCVPLFWILQTGPPKSLGKAPASAFLSHHRNAGITDTHHLVWLLHRVQRLSSDCVTQPSPCPKALNPFFVQLLSS